MHDWPDVQHLPGWVDFLQKYGVYFSEPLDLDMAMLKAFPGAYDAVIPAGSGPRMAQDKAAEAVLGTAGPGLTVWTGPYAGYEDLFPAYRYHFLTQSKPATHLAALVHIKRKELIASMPPVFKALLEHVAKSLRRD